MTNANPAGRPGHTRHAARAAALALATVTFAVAVLLGLGAAAAIRGDGCPLPALRFDVDAARQVGSSWLPPTVTCEYRLASGESGRERHAVWTLFAPAPAAVALAAAALWWRRRP